MTMEDGTPTSVTQAILRELAVHARRMPEKPFVGAQEEWEGWLVRRDELGQMLQNAAEACRYGRRELLLAVAQAEFGHTAWFQHAYATEFDACDVYRCERRKLHAEGRRLNARRGDYLLAYRLNLMDGPTTLALYSPRSGLRFRAPASWFSSHSTTVVSA